MTNLFEAYINKKTRKGENSRSYVTLIEYWCYRQLLGLFPIKGEKENSPYNLLDHWTSIKRFLILYGRCVSLELGGDIVVAKVDKVKRNLSEKILQIEISLNDEESTKKSLFTELGKKKLNRELETLKDELRKGKRQRKNFSFGLDAEAQIKRLEAQLIEGDRKFVFWRNNCDENPDMLYIDPLLNDLEDIHDTMTWDRKKSRKQHVVYAAKRPNETAWAKTKTHLEEDYVCLVYPEEELPGNSFTSKLENPEPRQKDLWEDHYKTFDFLRRMIGILHNTNKKKERQNNPELEMIENQFLTFQEEKRDLLEKGIRDWIEVFGGKYRLIPVEEIEENQAKKDIIKEKDQK